MNWNKVLNTFILVFLLINVLLFGYQKFYESNRYTVSEDRALQSRITLAKHGITIYEYTPRYYPKAQLVLGAPEYDKETIVQTVLGSDYKIKLDENSLGERIYTENSYLVFYVDEQEGYIYYHSEEPQYVPINLTQDKVDKTVKAFAEDLFGNDVKMEVTYRRRIEDEAGGGYRIEMNEIYGREEDIVFQTFIKLHITKDGIQEALAVRYIPVEYTGDKKNIYPFDEVSYNLMYYLEDEKGKLEDGEMVCKNIDIGYFATNIDSEKQNHLLDPQYRVIFENGETYYVNAYTNRITKPE